MGRLLDRLDEDDDEDDECDRFEDRASGDTKDDAWELPCSCSILRSRCIDKK
jgi:hypothetical protein